MFKLTTSVLLAHSYCGSSQLCPYCVLFALYNFQAIYNRLPPDLGHRISLHFSAPMRNWPYGFVSSPCYSDVRGGRTSAPRSAALVLLGPDAPEEGSQKHLHFYITLLVEAWRLAICICSHLTVASALHPLASLSGGERIASTWETK